jgi:hypothetical protein
VGDPDAGGLSSGNTVFAGVPIGQQTLLGSDVFTPALSLTNFGAKAVTATITLAVTNGNGPSGKKLATVTVAGQSSVTVPLGAMTGDSQMRNSFIVQSTGGQGMLYAGLTVFGGTTYRSVQLPGKDWWRPYNGGAHPWTTASATNSTLLLFNYADTPNQLTVAIGTGGMLWQQSYQLAPMETRALDIGNLIATGAKDQNGQVLPKTATAGVVNWFTLGFGQAMGRLLVSQPGIGLARSFNCDTVEAYCGTSEMPNNSLTIPASQGAPMGPYEVDMCTAAMGECEGDYDTSAPTSTNWSSSNTSVASIPASQDEAVAEISGISGGSATITANGVTEVLYDEIDGENYGCEAPGQSGVANVYDPTPVITGVSPTTGFVVGEAGAVTLTGQNFGTNKPQVSFSLGGTVTVSSNTDTSIQASLTAASAGTGTFTVTSEGYDGQSFKSSSGQNQQSGASPSVAVSGLPQVSISGSLGVPLNGTGSYTVTVSAGNSVSITLSLKTTSGSGSATFSNGGSSQTITQTTTVTVKGAGASSTANNIQLQASAGSSVLASATFSVVSVSISLSSSGSPSPDDGASTGYESYTGNTTLGQILEHTSPNSCNVGVQLHGAVTPSNYTGTVILRRTINGAAGFTGTAGQTSVSTGKSPGQDDTSGASLLDSSPQSGGSNGAVYDLDAPGTGADGDNINRVRFNFTEYAVLDAVTNTQSLGSLAWYMRDSCVENPNPTNGYLVMFSAGVSGDNTVGSGTTNLTWNLQ